MQSLKWFLGHGSGPAGPIIGYGSAISAVLIVLGLILGTFN